MQNELDKVMLKTDGYNPIKTLEVYTESVRFRESEKSRVFIKVTKTKTVAAYGQLIDVLFGTGEFPIS